MAMSKAVRAKPRISIATLALVLAGLIALAAIIYATSRNEEESGAVRQPSSAAAPTPQQQAQSLDQMIAGLRQRLGQDPDNHELWFMLGLAHRDFGQYREAEQAFRRAMQLQPANPDYLASTGEALLLIGAEGAARQAEPLFRRALEARRDHPQSRYYLATLKDLAGNHRGAVDELIALLREAPADAAWAPGVRRTVEEIAERHKIDIASRLPAAPPQRPATTAKPGPTREQMEAARNIPPAEQDQMVKAMVDGLAARLRQNPRDERGWMMLMRSRIVQGDRAAAAEAFRSAQAAFAGDAAALQRLGAAAAELGIPQG